MLFINFCYSYNFSDILHKVALGFPLTCKAESYLTCKFRIGVEINQYTIILEARDGTIEKIILKSMFNDRLHKFYFKIINQSTSHPTTKVDTSTHIYDIENDIYPYKYIFDFYSDYIKNGIGHNFV